MNFFITYKRHKWPYMINAGAPLFLIKTPKYCVFPKKVIQILEKRWKAITREAREAKGIA